MAGWCKGSGSGREWFGGGGRRGCVMSLWTCPMRVAADFHDGTSAPFETDFHCGNLARPLSLDRGPRRKLSTLASFGTFTHAHVTRATATPSPAATACPPRLTLRAARGGAAAPTRAARIAVQALVWPRTSRCRVSVRTTYCHRGSCFLHTLLCLGRPAFASNLAFHRFAASIWASKARPGRVNTSRRVLAVCSELAFMHATTCIGLCACMQPCTRLGSRRVSCQRPSHRAAHSTLSVRV